MQVVVGRIGRPHGITGEVTVEVRTDDPDGRMPRGATLLTEPEAAGPLTVTRSRVHGDRLLLAFAGVTDRAAAERLRGVLLVADVDPDERPEDPEEYYDRQLVGLRVETVAGRVVGELAEVLHLPGHDVLSVRRPGGGEVLVPFVAAIVPTVDIDGGRVLVDPPAGLIDDADDGPGE